VNQSIPENPDVPVWAREDAFPAAPDGWGWIDGKGKSHPCDTRESLIAAIRDDRAGSVTLVWAPGHARMILPEELEGTGDAMRAARAQWTRDDYEDAAHKLRWFGMILLGFGAYAFYGGFMLSKRLAENAGTASDVLQQLKFAAITMVRSTESGLALLMFVIFAFIPWYQARKRRNNLPNWTDTGIAESIPIIRFEIWLERQKAPVTKVLLGLITLVALAQIFSGLKTMGWGSWAVLIHNWDGTSAAGLMKEHYRAGEWWRLFTAPFLHGNIVHFLMNAAALAYLGKRVEVFARWPHLPLVYLFAACCGGEASARLIAAPSVGASGGLMGWLGFLLVFETLHKRLVPLGATRRLAAGVVLTAAIGLVGYRYIDNAAHAGGLLAGMLYALIVFPSSTASQRPRSNLADRLAGSAALLALTGSAVFALMRIMAISI
jgi:membrane associated rhomboid family serine protease